MTWNDLQAQVHTTPPATGEDTVDETYAADVLLQIILPMVLVLAFLVINALRQFEEQTKPSTPTEHAAAFTKTLIELQRQKLVLALANVERGRRIMFGIDYFEHKKATLAQTGQVLTNDPFLVAKCYEISRVYQSPATIAAENRRLYTEVLSASGLQDQPPRAQAALQPTYEDHVFLTDDNRLYLTTSIAQITDALQTEIADRQRALVQQAFLFYAQTPIAELYRWHPRLQEIGAEIAKLEAEQKDATALRVAQTEEVRQKMKQDFRAQGYIFLEDAWNATTP